MRFVSIGGDCQVSHNIKRTQPSYEKHFFDWLVIPAASVAKLIETDFKSFLRPEDLEPQFKDDVLERVTDRSYNAWYFHDFKSLKPADIEVVQKKYQYLADKFISLLRSNSPTCFVRRWHPLDGNDVDSAAENLLKTIRKKSKNASLLYVHQDAARPLRQKKNFTSVAIKDIVGDWHGDEAAWEGHLCDIASR